MCSRLPDSSNRFVHNQFTSKLRHKLGFTTTDTNINKRRLSEVLSHAKCPRCNSKIRMLLHMLEIITISDANIVGTNGLRAGVQVWQKKIKLRLSNAKT
jgi:hypothetical protein